MLRGERSNYFTQNESSDSVKVTDRKVTPRAGVLSPRLAFATVAFAIFLLLMGSNVATPLYDVYRRQWHFSAFEMTAVFATYPFTLVFALWGFGRLSDRFGRKPVIVASLVAACAGSLLFATAHGPASLFAARFVLALSVALLSGAGAAALVELEPNGNRRRAALVATLMFASGSAVAPLLTGILAQYAAFPQVLSYLVHIALTVPLIGLALFLPETAPRNAAEAHWLPRLPVLPRAIRMPFAIASLTAGISWLTVAMYFALVPSYLRVELHVTNLAVLGFVPFALMAVSTVAQFRVGKIPERKLMGISLVLMTAGIVAVVFAVPAQALLLIALGTLLGGVGNAMGALGSLATVTRIAPEATRGETISLYYSIFFLTVALPMLAVGGLASRYGFFAAFAAFALMVAAISMAIGFMLRVSTLPPK